MTATTDTKYNVVCMDCGQVFTPAPRSPLWWQAKQRAEQGYLDALCVQGEKCGCKPAQPESEAPFRVFGYDILCADFDIPFGAPVPAMKKFLELRRRDANVVFISGLSPALTKKLEWGSL